MYSMDVGNRTVYSGSPSNTHKHTAITQIHIITNKLLHTLITPTKMKNERST